MMIIRPVRPDDLDDLFRLARKAKAGMTTLPPDRRLLEKKIEASLRAFARDTSQPGDDHYLFVLEDRGNGSAVGTAGIVSAVGLSEAFYSYRVSTVVHASRELGVYNKMSGGARQDIDHGIIIESKKITVTISVNLNKKPFPVFRKLVAP